MKIEVEVDVEDLIRQAEKKGWISKAELSAKVRESVRSEINSQVKKLVSSKINVVDIKQLVEQELVGVDFNVRIRQAILEKLNHECSYDY